MNDSQVRTFLTVAACNNFSRAAELLYVSQPTVSKAIALLEKELGVKLFRRTANRRIQLTEAGQIYYQLFLRHTQELEAAKAKVDSMVQASLVIRFAYPIGWNFSKVLPLAMEQVHRYFPHAALDVQCLSFREIRANLKKNTTDITIFIDMPLHSNGKFHKETVAQVRRVILYSEQFVALNGPVHSPADFSSATFLLTDNDRDDGYDEYVRAFCTSLGFVPGFRYVKNRQTVLAMVENGLGVTLFDAWGLVQNDFLHMELDSYHTVSMVWSDNLPEAAARCFVESFQKYFR